MKLNNKGFAVTGILYTLLVLFLVLMISLISVFSNRKNILDKLKQGVVKDAYLNSVYSYEYDDSIPYYIFNAPIDGTYKIELWGAQGGFMVDGFGLGAYVSGNINLKKGTILYIYVGESGKYNRQLSYNGGGYGGYSNAGFNISSTISDDTGVYGNSGGGATDIRLVNGDWNNSQSLNSRIMVAGGGGGSSGYTSGGENGAAGGLIAYSGPYYGGHGDLSAYGTGGTQTSGGIAGKNIYSGVGTNYAGTFGMGGSSDSYSSGADLGSGSGGGGAGYYGGGSGGATGTGGSGNGGGGGSSYISGHTGCVAITSETDQTPKTGCTTGTTNQDCSVHYSNYQFTNTSMIDGGGYSWTTEKGTEIVGMPTHDGVEIMTGNTGNGYAKITIVKVD